MTENRILNNRYKLETEIGRGGMGVVYRAIDTQLHRTVAIKVLPPEFVHNTQFLARFNSEIRNTSQLEHQNIVSVYDVGVDDNTNYYVMQYVDGQDLKAYLAQHGRLSVADTCKILGQIASALDYAHDRGIIHRDIKPENILIDRHGVPSLTDFGIARSMEGTRMTSGMVGTPEYMSPEQAKGEDVSGSSDQYSLAIVAYEMLTGTTPFRSSTAQPWAVVNKHINEPPPDQRTIVTDLDGNATDALITGLAKNVSERHLTCVKFIEAMQQVKTKIKVDIKPKEKVVDPEEKIGLTILLVLAAVLIFILVGKYKSKPIISDNSNTTPSPTVVTPPTPPPLKTNPKDGAEMILIPAGDFLMGTSENQFATLIKDNPTFKRELFTCQMPQHKVALDAYYIYKTEVTVAQYRKFCTSTGRKMSNAPDWGLLDNHPIVNVTWDDAKAYANWAGVELPTEAQWEKAARGTDGRIYPWGNEWDSAKCANYANSGDSNTSKGTHPVGSFPMGVSPYGVQDMAGNAWEWCIDWYDKDYYKTAPVKNPTGPEIGKFRVLRGSSWRNYYGGNSGSYRVAYRNYGGYGNYIGFRCALPIAGLHKSKSIISENSNDRLSPTVVSPLPPAPLKINPKDGAEMILIPAGDFLMGSTDEDERASEVEKPQYKVYLDAYYIYKTEVTVARYRKFCTATDREMPDAPDWGWKENHPIVKVTWNDAKAYADWAGAVLPTEAQWEKAARGTNGRIFPWGSTWDETKCVNSTNNGTKPVGSFPIGASPYGVMDMAGNAWEWCEDWFTSYYETNAPVKNPTGPEIGECRVVRGGSWDNDYFFYGYDNYYFHRCASRYNKYRQFNYDDDLGFRCVVSSP